MHEYHECARLKKKDTQQECTRVSAPEITYFGGWGPEDTYKKIKTHCTSKGIFVAMIIEQIALTECHIHTTRTQYSAVAILH